MAINIAKLLAKNLGKGATAKTLGFQPMTLVSITPGTRGAVLTAGNNPTPKAQTCTGAFATKRQGFWQFWQNAQAGTGTSRATYVTIAILGDTLKGVVPKAGDRIIVVDTTYTIDANGVTNDQVGAMYTCTCRTPGA